MKDITDLYSCENCGQAWSFFPNDYEGDNYPDTCPLCSMPLWEMIRDTFKVGGVGEVIKHLVLRFL